MKKIIFLLSLIISLGSDVAYSQSNNDKFRDDKAINIAEGKEIPDVETPKKPEGAQEQDKTQDKETERRKLCLFFGTQILFLTLVFFGYPLLCRLKLCFLQNGKSPPLKGLNLPQGSVRAMIAIAIIGSYLITLSLGSTVLGDGQFDKIVAAFGSLVGAVVGFYFGSRSNESEDKKNNEPNSEVEDSKNDKPGDDQKDDVNEENKINERGGNNTNSTG